MRIFTSSSVALGIGAMGLSLFGFGCAKKEQPVKTPQAAQQNFPASPKTIKPTMSVEEQYREVLNHFMQAKSLRAKIDTDSSDGKITGKISIAKPNRFSATMKVGKAESTDLIIVDDSLFVRQTGGIWSAYDKSKKAKTLGDVIRRTFAGEGSLASSSTIVTIDKSYDDSRACDLYRVTSVASSGSQTSADVCVVNEYPRFVRVQNNLQPELNIEYSDYNAVFSIEKPI